jgi:RNA-dependent RNA polymerase
MYSSRLGQALSSTFPTVELPRSAVLQIDEVVRNGFVFSDGIGTISKSLATKIAAMLPCKKFGIVPSAFQIRYSGIKGLLPLSY